MSKVVQIAAPMGSDILYQSRREAGFGIDKADSGNCCPNHFYSDFWPIIIKYAFRNSSISPFITPSTSLVSC